MAYIFSDGFDNYTTASQIWDSVASATISAGSARFPVGNARGINVANSIQKNLNTNPGPTVFILFSFRPVTALAAAGNIIFSLKDTGTEQLNLFYGPTGVLQFRKGTSPIGASSGTFAVAGNQYYRAEAKIVFNNSTGSVELRINGNSTPVISSGSLNTVTTANNYFNQLNFQGPSTNGTDFDDIVILDSTAASLNNYLGDRKLLTAMPTGAGAVTQFTPNGSGANWQCVDEIPPNDDTDYVSDGTLNDSDLYTVQALTFSGSADFAVVRLRARRDDANPHNIQARVHSNASDAFSSDIGLNSTYAFFDSLFENDPNTSAHWAQAGQNAMQIGQKITL